MAIDKYWNGTAWEEVKTNASAVPIADSGNLITATNVEGALQEIVNAAGTHYNKASSETVVGHTALATAAETTTGTSTSKAVHPAGLKVELDKKLSNSLATGANQALVSTAAGAWAVKTLDQIKTWLGLGSAAYTASTAYATATQGAKADASLQKHATPNTAGYFDTSTTAPTNSTRLNYSGYLYATRMCNSVFNDFAEYFERGEATEPGDIIALNPNGPGYIRAAGLANKFVRGVHSDTFGNIVGGAGAEDDEEKFIPVGLIGRVKVKIFGKACKGQYVIASDVPGVGIAIDEYVPGAVIGQIEEDKLIDDVDRVSMFIMRV